MTHPARGPLSINSTCQSRLMVCVIPAGTITSEIFPPFQSTISLNAASPSLFPVAAWAHLPMLKINPGLSAARGQ